MADYQWKCEHCGEAVNPDDAVLEEHFSYEGEAWGYAVAAQKVYTYESPCCNAGIVDQDGFYLEA